MKKILKVLILVLVLSVTRINRVMAETFYEDNWISGVYANLVDGDFSKPQQMRFIKRRSDNKPVYCLTPRETIYETENYTKYNAANLNVLNMTIEKYLRLSEIAYFGYGYPGHTSDEWYAITQFMLWREMEPNMDIFFTDKFKGNRITRFETEMNEVENLIANFKKTPNFGEINLLPNTEYKLDDLNNTLNTYNIYSTDGLDISKNNNTLIIKTKNIGEYIFSLLKIPDLYYDTSYIYKANNGQDLLITGAISSIHASYKASVTKGKLNINKKDNKTLENISNAKYILYDKNNNLVDTVITDINGNCYIDNLIYGKYKLKEIQAPIGYKLDTKIYDIDINNEEEYINLQDEKITGRLTITKKLNDTNLYEKDIKFNIYDDNNNFIKQIITDSNGKASIILEYGKYKIVQQNTTLGYKKVSDFYINIINEESQNITLEDERIITNIKVIKKDIDSKKPITASNTKFKIYDVLNEEYIKVDNKDIFKTNNGEFIINIKGGKYILEEIESPNGYILNDNIEFTIDENTNIIDDTYTIDFYNEKQYGILHLNKLGKLNNGNFIPLSNISFGLYAYEDIITDDNSIHYKKDELIEELITDKNGEVLSINLPIGKYYIKELKTLDNYIIDENKYIIDFNNNIDLKTIYKGITITNDEKNIKFEDNKYFCKLVDNKYYDSNSNIVTKEEYEKSCNKKEINENIILNDKNTIENKEEIKEQKIDKEKNTIFPKTSNIEIFINTIISYILLIGFIIIIKNIKHEK